MKKWRSLTMLVMLGCTMITQSLIAERIKSVNHQDVSVPYPNRITMHYNTESEKLQPYLHLCGYNILIDDSLVLNKSTEYYLDNGIIYIREYYTDRKLKSESYWINKIKPVLVMVKYNHSGSIAGISTKKMEVFDIDYAIRMSFTDERLKTHRTKIIYISKDADFQVPIWRIVYKESDYDQGNFGQYANINTHTGQISIDGFMTQESEDSYSERMTEEELPNYIGGRPALNKFIGNSIDLPKDQLYNEEIKVFFELTENGELKDVRLTETSHKILWNEVVRICKRMPNWSLTDQPDTGKPKRYGFSVIFRSIE